MQATESTEKPKPSPLALEVAKKIKEKRYVGLNWKMLLSLNDSTEKILRIFGRINIKKADEEIKKNTGGFFSSQKVNECSNLSKYLHAIFQEIFKVHLDNLKKDKELTSPTPHSLLGKQSALQSCLPLRVEIFNYMKFCLSIDPYPHFRALSFKVNQIRRLGEEVTPGIYAEMLQDRHLENIVLAYRYLGTNITQQEELSLETLIDLEITLVKCVCTRHESSWSKCIEEWAKHAEWGKKDPEIPRIAEEFLKIHQLTPLLKEESSTQKSAATSTLNLSTNLPIELSFHNFILELTLREIYCDILNARQVSLDDMPKKLNALFLKGLKNEKNRQMVLFFLDFAFENYSKIEKKEKRYFTYVPYKAALKSIFGELKYFTHQKIGGKDVLKEEFRDIHELLAICFLMIHLSQLFTEISLGKKIVLLSMIGKLNIEDRKKLYEDIISQIPITSKFIQNLQIDDILNKYNFSNKRKALLILRGGFYQLGLRPHFPKGTYSPLDFFETYKFIVTFQNFCRCEIPEDAFFFLFFFQYLDKNEALVLEEMIEIRNTILSTYYDHFFIPVEYGEKIKSVYLRMFVNCRLPHYIAAPVQLERGDVSESPKSSIPMLIEGGEKGGEFAEDKQASFEHHELPVDFLNCQSNGDFTQSNQIEGRDDFETARLQTIDAQEFLNMERQLSYLDDKPFDLLRNNSESQSTEILPESDEIWDNTFTVDEGSHLEIDPKGKSKSGGELIHYLNGQGYSEHVDRMSMVYQREEQLAAKVSKKSEYSEEDEICSLIMGSIPAFQACLNFSAIYDKVSPFTFLHLVFEEGIWIYDEIAKWAQKHCCVLEELVPGMRSMLTDVYWEKREENKYFHIVINFLSSLKYPESHQIDVRLNISKSRLQGDDKLRVILYFFFQLCVDFNPRESQEAFNHQGVKEYSTIEDILDYVQPFMKFLWEDYSAYDKEAISFNLFTFINQLRTSLRSKMLKLALPIEDCFEEETDQLAQQGSVYVHGSYLSLLPITHSRASEGRYSIHKLNYKKNAELLLKDITTKCIIISKKKQKEIITELDDIFTLEVCDKILKVGISYSLKNFISKEIDSLEFLESDFEALQIEQLQEYLKNSETEEKMEKFQIITEEKIGNFHQRKSDIEMSFESNGVGCEVLFYLKEEPSINFKVIYQNGPKNTEIIYWQLIKLKEKCYQNLTKIPCMNKSTGEK